MKKISGYIRAIPSGEPLLDVPVSVLSAVTDALIPVNPQTGGTTNPVRTDPTHGLFTWSCELSPGPLKIDCEYLTGKHKVRSGYEVMQSGDFFLSDVPSLFEVFEVGVMPLVGQRFEATHTGLVLTVQPGGALIFGNMLETQTNRQFTLTTNTTLAERIDAIVLRQYIGGPYLGKQEILRLQGTVTGTYPPALNPDPNLFDLPLYYTHLPKNSSDFTLEDVRLDTFVMQSPTSVAGLVQVFGNSATGATTPSSSSEAAYVAALVVPFTLPLGKWTVHTWGSASWAISVSGQAIVRRIQIINADTGANVAVVDSGFSTTLFPDYSRYPVDLTKTSLDGGSYKAQIIYKVDATGPGGTAYCRAPELHGLAIRTGGVSNP